MISREAPLSLAEMVGDPPVTEIVGEEKELVVWLEDIVEFPAIVMPPGKLNAVDAKLSLRPPPPSKVTVPTPNALALLSLMVPSFSVVPPEYWLFPFKSKVPEPALVMAKSDGEMFPPSVNVLLPPLSTVIIELAAKVIAFVDWAKL